jgi:hypothetical protein
MGSERGFRFSVFGFRKLWREISVFRFQCLENRCDTQFSTLALTLELDSSPLNSFEISNLKSQIRAAHGGRR